MLLFLYVPDPPQWCKHESTKAPLPGFCRTVARSLRTSDSPYAWNAGEGFVPRQFEPQMAFCWYESG